ncbi:Hypothetical predicted protein [Mytilus galloprovincialis]|uniref:C1q domain-containing protein n=1 Tax=Mytilus galloprovincialis TaxID=29158 RepID=A0A8B6D0R1_MYTGA|nr:Hypothetical predicted protein [Mytilus galloprovincialis]
MMMKPTLTCILFVLMCRGSIAHFTMTLPSGTTTVGSGNKVKYNTVVDNPTGSGYNPTTGCFTVVAGTGPAGAGVYSISVSMMSGFDPSHLTIRKGSQVLVWLYTDKDYNMASQTINVNLVLADQICVQMETGSDLFDVYNTFSMAKIA